jgi:hypothetical protein
MECHKCRQESGILTSTLYIIRHKHLDDSGAKEALPIAHVEKWKCEACGHQWEITCPIDGDITP